MIAIHKAVSLKETFIWIHEFWNVYLYNYFMDKIPLDFVVLPTFPELPDFFSFRTNWQDDLETRGFLAIYIYICKYTHNLYCHLLEKREHLHLNEIHLLDLLVFVYSPVCFSFFQEEVSFTLK